MSDRMAHILEGIDETDLLPFGFTLEDVQSQKIQSNIITEFMNNSIIINDAIIPYENAGAKRVRRQDYCYI